MKLHDILLLETQSLIRGATVERISLDTLKQQASKIRVISSPLRWWVDSTPAWTRVLTMLTDVPASLSAQQAQLLATKVTPQNISTPDPVEIAEFVAIALSDEPVHSGSLTARDLMKTQAANVTVIKTTFGVWSSQFIDDYVVNNDEGSVDDFEEDY